MEPIQNKKKIFKTIFLIVVFVILIILVRAIINVNSKIQQNKIGDNVSAETKEFAEKQKEIFGKKEMVDPKDSIAKRELSLASYLLGDYKKAEKLINEAITIDGSNPQFYVDLGRIYETKNDTVNAEKMYKKAIDLVKKASEINVVSKSTQNILYIEVSDFIKKVSETSVIPEQPKDISKEPTQPSQSEDLQKNAINIIPTPFTSLAQLYINQKKDIEAIKVLEEGIIYVSKYPDFYSLLSDIYKKLGDTQKSEYYEEQFQMLIKPN